MDRDDRAILESEIAMLDEMLATIGSGRVIERVGLEARVEALRAQLREEHEDRATLLIPQEELAIEGMLVGVLPDARRFEARRASDGALLSGRIDRSAGDPDELLTTWRGKPARLRVRETRVRSARPSYVLLAIQATRPS